MHKLPNLYRNRLGTYYLRITIAGREIKRSLGTKEPALAKKAALTFALAKSGGSVDFGHGFRCLDRLASSQATVHQNVTGSNPTEDIERSAEILSAPTSNEALMLTIPTAFTKFDVLMPNGIKLLGIEDDDEAQRAAFFLREALGVAGIDPAYYVTKLEEAVEATKAKQANQATATGKSKPFSKVAALYLAEKQLDNGRKTLEDKQATFDTFVELFGDDDFNAVGAEQAVAYKQRLLAQALSIVRINSKLSHLTELFRWAVNNGLRHTGNPFETMRVSTKGKIKQQTKSYIPFSDEDLQAIFEPARYAAFMDKPDYFWLPWIALHSGARIEELASLTIDQVRTDAASGVVYVDIQKAKNLNSVRQIPLHDNVVSAGFLDYIASVKALGGTNMVFPYLVEGKNGYSKNCGRRFAQYLDTLGITDERKTFHSFRSTFITRLSEQNANPAMLMAIVGHYEQHKVDLSSPHFQNYQGKKLLTALKETVQRFAVPGVAMAKTWPKLPRKPQSLSLRKAKADSSSRR